MTYTQDTIPTGYIIRNDGFFGEWNLWLDDTLGTIIGNGYESKQDAISAAWKHKENNSMLAPKGYTITGLLDTDYRIRRWVYDTPEGISSDDLYESKQDAISAAWQHKENQSKGDVMIKPASIILYAPDAYGQYIPQYFAESVDRSNVTGISEDDYNILLEGPENELYWDTWNDVECNARITNSAGNVYALHQDGDLFLICDELMTYEQKREFFDIEVYGEDEDASVVFDVPEWIDHDITLGQMQSISEGGCASGAYMPAVTYHNAKETMSEHGDDVLKYIEDSMGEIPAPSNGESWSGIAVHYLSMAVELWAGQIDSIEVE